MIERVNGDGGLTFEVLDARAERYAAQPTLALRLRVGAGEQESVHAVALQCQIRIEPQRRRYEADEEDRLAELFGEPARWGETLRPFLWTNVGDDDRRVRRFDRGRPLRAVHL